MTVLIGAAIGLLGVEVFDALRLRVQERRAARSTARLSGSKASTSTSRAILSPGKGRL